MIFEFLALFQHDIFLLISDNHNSHHKVTKTYYGRVDAINSILSICGHDRKSRRKTLRVNFCV